MKLSAKITLKEAIEIKHLLWESIPQDVIANHYNISQATISRILHGKQWGLAPWPDKTLGGFPLEKLKENRAKAYNLSKTIQVNPMQDAERKALIRDTIEALGIDIQSDMEESFDKALRKISKKNRNIINPANGNNKPVRYDFLAWKNILEKDPLNKIVISANDENDKVLKKAIGVVFKAIPVENWRLKRTQTLINEVYKTMKETE